MLQFFLRILFWVVSENSFVLRPRHRSAWGWVGQVGKHIQGHPGGFIQPKQTLIRIPPPLIPPSKYEMINCFLSCWHLPSFTWNEWNWMEYWNDMADEERCAGSRVSVMKNSPKARIRSFLPGPPPSCVCARARLLHLVTTLDVHRRVASLHALH